jgi:hypothetical protein
MGMTTMADQQSDEQMRAVPGESAVPAWVMVLAAVAALAMGSQIRFPWLGGRVGIADAALGLAFAAFLLDQLRRGVAYRYPALLGGALLVYTLASLLARPGAAGAMEIVQRFEQLVCGYLVWALLLRERRSWLGGILTVLLAANVLVAALQTAAYGYGSVLAPADVMALPWGIGKAYTGLFRSRVALSLFLAVGLALVQPLWYTWAGASRFRQIAAIAGTAMVLVMIPHGGILLACIVALLAAGILNGAGNGWRSGAAVLCAAVVLLASGRMTTVAATLSPAQPGSAELKSCHVDLLAALRMAALRPWTGVGAGTYQKYIGQCYGELPNANVNDVETDTQSGLGILLGSAGYPAALLLLLAILAGLVRATEAFIAGGKTQPLLLGAASALAIFLPAMVVTDPFVRGPAWFLSLALAVACGAAGGTAAGAFAVGWRRTFLAGILVVSAAALLFVLPKTDALARRSGGNRPRPVRAAVGGSLRPETIPAGVPAPAAAAAAPAASSGSSDFFRVLNAAADAKLVTPPVEKGPDSQSAKGTILRIPDKKGVPPEGQDSDMKYGGATYELQVAAAVTCKIWVRAWWEGSCGNTVCVRLGEQGKILTVGNDGTYDSWHWLEVPGTFSLEKGTITLYLLNREDGIRIDQILLTNDMEYFPQGVEEE